MFVGRARAVREARKVWRAALDLGCDAASEIIAGSISTGMVWHVPMPEGEGRYSVYLPSNRALESARSRLTPSAMEALVRRCVVPIGPPPSAGKPALARKRKCDIHRIDDLADLGISV